MTPAASPWITHKLEDNFPTEPRQVSGMTLVFLLSGSLEIQVGPQRHHMRANDFLFFRPYEVFYAPYPSQVYRAFTITIERQMIWQMCPNFDRIHFDLQLIRCQEDDSTYQSICTSLAKLVYAIIKPDICSDLSMLSSCGDILSQLISAYGLEADDDSLRSMSHTQDRVVSILRYISENYTEGISLADIASYVGLHPQYFSAFFKKQFGANFSDYLGNYRAAQSLHALRYTNESILNIAIANGFNNHKSYSAAFQKAYGMLPRDYRKQFQKGHPEGDPYQMTDEQTELFHVFHQYWNSDGNVSPRTSALKSERTISFREDPLQSTAFPNQMLHVVSVGRALDCLRSDVQQHLRQAKDYLHLDHVRIRDIFSDALAIYHEGPDKQPLFNWRTLDIIFDFLLSIQLKPLSELGYMPIQLASKKQYAGWQYHPNISSPKSYSRWAHLVRSFFEHCIDRYGAEEVRSWYFEFWTNPNLQLENSYWNESQEEFFHFYQVTYEAIHQVDPQIRLGTPNFSYPAGLSWYEAFFTFARQQDLHPAFVSLHAYSIDDGQSVDSPDGRAALYRPLAPKKDYLRKQVDDVRDCCKRGGFPDLDLIVSDWNVSYVPQDYTRDTSFMGPYILSSFARVLDRVKGLSFWSLSDVHGEFFYSDTLFHGGPGLLDYYGVPKAAYLALSFVYQLGRQILQVGEDYILAKDGANYQLVLFNLDFYDQTYRIPSSDALTYTQRYNVYEAARSLNFHAALSVRPGTYTITRWKIGRESGSSYDVWQKMGGPNDLKGGLLPDYLKARSIPDIYIETAAGPDIVIQDLVDPHGVTFISIEPTEHST